MRVKNPAVGDRCYARCNDGLWYSGTLMAIGADADGNVSYLVLFDDSHELKVPAHDFHLDVEYAPGRGHGWQKWSGAARPPFIPREAPFDWDAELERIKAMGREDVD